MVDVRLVEQALWEVRTKSRQVYVTLVRYVVHPSEASRPPEHYTEPKLINVWVGIYFQVGTSVPPVYQQRRHHAKLAALAVLDPLGTSAQLLLGRDEAVDQLYYRCSGHLAELCRTAP